MSEKLPEKHPENGSQLAPQGPRGRLPFRVSFMLGFLALSSYAHGAASAVTIAAGCYFERPVLALAGAILGLSALGGALAFQRLEAQAVEVFVGK